MTPDFSVSASDADVTAHVRRYLVELRVVETLDRTSDHMELVLSDAAAELAVPSAGRVLAVSMGYVGRLAPMGRYSHTETEIDLAPRVLRIRATAEDFRSRSTLKAPRTRSWDEVTLEDVVGQIAEEHGYVPAVGPGLSTEAIAHIDQTSESDLHLLRRLANHYGAVAKVADERLLFLPSGSQEPASASGGAMPIATIPAPPSGADSLVTVTGAIKRTDKSRYGAVRASYYDVDGGELAHVTAGTGSPSYDLRDPRPTRAQALADAKAKLASLTRQTRSLELTVPGDPDLSAGGQVATEGWGDGADDTWQITRVEHQLTAAGYTTRLAAEGLSND